MPADEMLLRAVVEQAHRQAAAHRLRRRAHQARARAAAGADLPSVWGVALSAYARVAARPA